MTSENRDIVEHSIEAFVKEVVDMTLDGWAISPTNPGDSVGFGNTYTVSMFRDENTVEAFRQKGAGVAEKPKLTRAEILQKARDAKKAKVDCDNVQ